MNNNIEHKIEETLQSIEGIERAKANPFLFGKVMNRMKSQKTEPVYNGKVILRYAFVVFLLAGINFLTLYHSDKILSGKGKEKMAAEAFANEYFINVKTFEY